MFDFSKVKMNRNQTAPTDPIEIFRRMPKPEWINDLYTSQSDVLKEWYSRRDDKDVVLKLHTGGGKTLVGLLIAQSTINEFSEPVLYLTPTKQLVTQTLEKASELGITAVPYQKGAPLDRGFVNGNAIMVATYNALFNGLSKFGLAGGTEHQNVKSLILDDAHAAFGIVRDSFTINISTNSHPKEYQALCSHFREQFKDVNQEGVYDDIVNGKDDSVVEVPYWSWQSGIDYVREVLKPLQEVFKFEWPLLRNRLHLCHALVGKHTFTITPVLPFVDLFPSFFDADRRVYMSATIADDSELIRTFDSTLESATKPITSRSLAGVSERLILVPEQMPFEFDNITFVRNLAKSIASSNQGAVVLVPSMRATEKWDMVATVAQTTEEVETYVASLQAKSYFGPVVFANRYDGIDLPNDSCRLLILDGLPQGTTCYEVYRAISLGGGITINRGLAQKIEQGLGRGSRGAGDHCVIILMGKGFANWLNKKSNADFLTSVTQIQLQIGCSVSERVTSKEDYTDVVNLCLGRDKGWQRLHAETLADNVDTAMIDENSLTVAAAERKAFSRWIDLNHDSAISKLEKAIPCAACIDKQTNGWILQLSGMIAHHWGHRDKFRSFQRDAVAKNRNLSRLEARPPYTPVSVNGQQAERLCTFLSSFTNRYAIMASFKAATALLTDSSSSNQFEQAFSELMTFLGFVSERKDERGVGPDILVFIDTNTALVVEAKSRKDDDNPLRKREHAQLLVAMQWFKQTYPKMNAIPVQIHKTSIAQKAASATETFALTLEKIASISSKVQQMLSSLIESSLPHDALVQECDKLLRKYHFDSGSFLNQYFIHFSEVD